MQSLAQLSNLSGRAALVTGAAGHIGSVACETLIELGCRVAVLDRDSKACEVRAHSLNGSKVGSAIALPCDLLDEQATREAAQKAVEALGGLDVLVHCAAFVGTPDFPGWVVPFEKQTVEAWDAAMRVNLTSAFVLAQATIEALQQSGKGSIVLFSSTYGIVSPDQRMYEGMEISYAAGYAASKGGLLQLMRYLSTTLAPSIRVNAISPGGVWRDQPEQFHQRYKSRTPLQRMATEEDLKGAIAYLSTDLSAYVTGHNLVVDGGVDLLVATLQLGDRLIGDGHPCFIVAEAGVNHNGSIENAIELVNKAKAAGADAVKFQLFRIAEQLSRNAPTADYQRSNAGFDNMFEMARTYDLAWEDHRRIAARCRELGIQYMASCFDRDAVDYAVGLGVPAIKIASGEITNYPLLAYAAQTGKALLLSTGMCLIEDVRGAVNHIRKNGNPPLILLHCVSNYPAAPKSVNLRAMASLRKTFDTPVGYSDHTLGNTAATAAAALGACVIEKHFTLDKNLRGPDHAMSLDPGELENFVSAIREAEAALGDGCKRPDANEMAIAAVARRSLVSARVIGPGERLDDANVCLKRPATGIDPRLWETFKGRRVKVEIPADVPITEAMLD